ncbi:MAG: MFS transporter [Janthinobacterium lividum]
MSITTADVFETNVPQRLDRLPWSRFHTLIVMALGITWILDGLEVTLVGSLASAIAASPRLQLTDFEVSLTASSYLAGAVVGALFFGWLTDRLGRKKLFTITVLIYLLATIATGFSWNFWSFALFRFITGAGIGGEYAAVNSTIQELIPARKRGFTDLVINGSFWIGAALGSLGAVVVTNPGIMNPELGWRVAFVIGGVIGVVILFLRRFIPESPRWLMTHCQPEEASRVVSGIEAWVERDTGQPLPPPPPGMLRLCRHQKEWFLPSLRTLAVEYRSRTVLGIALMGSQAFCYNAVLFTYALVLTRFYGVESGQVGWFMLPFALGNFMGPLLLGRFFDTLGRKQMITATYALSGVLMAAVGWMFAQGWLDAMEQTLAWTVIFFFASAAASSAYLTVGETFPLEVRAVAISVFYALGMALGGIAGPAVFGHLIQTGSRDEVLWGYLLGGGLMVGAAAVEWVLGVSCEGRSLEEVAPPLSAA